MNREISFLCISFILSPRVYAIHVKKLFRGKKKHVNPIGSGRAGVQLEKRGSQTEGGKEKYRHFWRGNPFISFHQICQHRYTQQEFFSVPGKRGTNRSEGRAENREKSAVGWGRNFPLLDENVG
jgi:hypothetical protein